MPSPAASSKATTRAAPRSRGSAVRGGTEGRSQGGAVMSDVLELLARANPIPEAKRPELEARTSALADSRRLRTAAATKTSTRSLLRLAVVAIVGLLVLVVAGTALAVRAHWLDLSL